MVRVRRTEDGPQDYYNPHRNVRINDEQPEPDVSDDDAEYLVEEHGGFTYAEDDEDGGENTLAPEPDPEELSSQEPEATATDEQSEEADAADEDVGEGEADSEQDEFAVDLGSRGDLESLRHPDLKAIAEQLGIAEKTDLRSRDTIIDAVLDHVNAEG